MVRNPQVNAILECVHQVIGQMLPIAEFDMANQLPLMTLMSFLKMRHGAWATCFTYLTVLKASPGAAILGQDMLIDIMFIADWHKIGEHRQSLTGCGNRHKNNQRIHFNY
jgi:hypothetical protein